MHTFITLGLYPCRDFLEVLEDPYYVFYPVFHSEFVKVIDHIL